MEILAQAKYVRTSPRKLRLVADLVRPMAVDEALATLKFLQKRAAKPLYKVYKQAVGNAVNNLNLAADSLKLATLEINEGPTYKRFQPVSRGRAHGILKRTSHIKIVLKSAPKATPKATTKATTKAAPKKKGKE